MINQSFIEAYISDADSIPRNHRIYIAFILLWTLFESLIKDKTGITDNTRRAIDETKRNIGYLKDAWNKLAQTNWAGLTTVVKNNCPAYDKRFNPPTNPVDITDPSNPDLGQLIDVLYRFRCNLLHGYENIRSDDKIKLYTACRDILAQWTKQLT